ncbi:MAG: hypothetical protein GQ574_02260 [Crocinitomix sp.]|nr:hypothetical protein [Crocinitomix sp.]
MAKTREEYVEICKVCTNRDFNMKTGVICSLTNQHPDYSTAECPSFILDESAEVEQKNVEFKKVQDHRGSIIAGILSISIGVVIILVTSLAFGVIMAWPFAFIVGGIILLVKTKTPKRKHNNDLDEIM